MRCICRAVGADVERRAGVHRPAQHRQTSAQRLGQWLAAERAGVDNGLGADHGAVDRHDLTGAHEHDVADLDVVYRHLLEVAVDP
jgi:hypothetical protein